ncbi:MAG TPA: FAD-dependent oxidoreductase [Oscillospiraceae bacterium]|nr:FAD-dependent oxidoreductase [Oscillospiraceae bacterium]
MKIIIVGGVAAGASAATKARRVNEQAEIIILEKGPYVSFANCGLPYYVGGDIAKKDNLLLVTPELFQQRFRIEVRLQHEVLAIDAQAKTLTVQSAAGNYAEGYDKLVLATGAEPARPPLPGIDLPQVFTVSTVPDAEAIVNALTAGVQSAVIVGGGFIGLETAEALLKKGIKTTLVQRGKQLANNFDAEFSLPLEKHLQEMGLDIVLGDSLIKILGEESVEAVELGDGRQLSTDMVIMAVGVKPRIQLAQSAGLQLGQTGGVLVDASMQTTDPSIYAAGDLVEALHLVSRKKVRIPLAGSASKQGRVAGANAAGGKLLFKGVLGTAIIKVGELTVARSGLSEKEAEELGIDYFVAYTPAGSHAAYYPGSQGMIIKLTAESITGQLLGAQVIGRRGVDKRIDVLATAIYARLSVFDLENLDLAYAPPYGAAKDPVIMAGMIAANMVRGDVTQITPQQLRELQAQPGVIVLDVRTPQEFSKGAVAGAINIPVDELRMRYQELDSAKKVLVYCRTGYRSNLAHLFLRQQGFNASNVSGGYLAYSMDV